jgi:uncharacterized protein YaaN involved in tellurite resistance
MDETAKFAVPNEPVLSEEQKAKLEKLRGAIDSANANTIIQFGAGAQGKISEFSDKILADVKAKDTGYVGKALTDLMAKIREIPIDSLTGQDKGLLSKIPFLSAVIDSSKRFVNRYQSVSVHIEKIAQTLEQAKLQLINDARMLDGFYDVNMDYLKEIELYILAGDMKLKDLQEKVLPGMKADAENTGDQMAIQKYRDMAHLAARIEKRLHDLKLSRSVAMLSAPQIRMVQLNNQELAEKIQSSILNTIPLWKNQMIIAISLLRQRETLGAQQKIGETTKVLLEKNAEMLKESSVEIAGESEKGIVDIMTIKKVNADLISTIQETIRIQQQGRTKRMQAEQELERLESDLKQSLIDIKNSMQGNAKTQSVAD